MYKIQNTQQVLNPEPGKIYPSITVHLGQDGKWTLTKKPKLFKTKAGAERVITKAGLIVGRNEDAENNQLNIIEAVEA